MVRDSSVVLEIPASTTIAYGVIELYVKRDGQFGECRLLPGEEPPLRDTPSQLGHTPGRGPPTALGMVTRESLSVWGCPVTRAHVGCTGGLRGGFTSRTRG